MTSKYESELLFDLMKRDGGNPSSNVLPYESELIEFYINQVIGAYPKLQDYQAEWLNYKLNYFIPSDFPYESVSNVTNASFQNVVPYAYKSAILKGSTKYRDIDTGEFLETFEEGRNLELVSVETPVLTTVGKNLFTESLLDNPSKKIIDGEEYFICRGSTTTNSSFIIDGNKIDNKKQVTFSFDVINPNNATWCNAYIEYSDFQHATIKGIISSDRVSITSSAGKTISRIAFTAETGKEVYIKNIQLEHNSEPTTYEPYKSNILSTPSDLELRGIGDVKDELDLITGELTERICEVLLDGSENWRLIGFQCDWVKIDNMLDPTTNKSQISNLLPFTPYVLLSSKDYEWFNLSHTGSVNLKIAKSRLSSPDVDGLKTFLADNNLLIQYKLKTEVVKTVELSSVNEKGEHVKFTPIEGTMYAYTSSQTIQPLMDMSVPVEATIQNLNAFANMKEE